MWGLRPFPCGTHAHTHTHTHTLTHTHTQRGTPRRLLRSFRVRGLAIWDNSHATVETVCETHLQVGRVTSANALGDGSHHRGWKAQRGNVEVRRVAKVHQLCITVTILDRAAAAIRDAKQVVTSTGSDVVPRAAQLHPYQFADR